MIIEETGSQSLKIFAPAKLNLFLEVTGKRSDGYHDLDTIMHSVDLFDVLDLERVNGPTQLRVTGRETGPIEDNLVLKAVQLFNATLDRARGFRIHLDKRIPVGAGLGGGSADCAAALIGCNLLSGSPRSRLELEALGGGLGSDVPFFFHCGTARCQGRGERITPISGVPPLTFLVIYPGWVMSTRKVYQNLNLDLTKNKSNHSLVSALLKSGSSAAINQCLFNRLEPPAMELMPELSKVIEFAHTLGYSSLHVSGSGSSLFQVIEEEGLRGTETGTILFDQRWEAFVVKSSPKLCS
jgi:4-diphosphocytidyl-2-C-methyl-D-erythritol kinase